MGHMAPICGAACPFNGAVNGGTNGDITPLSSKTICTKKKFDNVFTISRKI